MQDDETGKLVTRLAVWQLAACTWDYLVDMVVIYTISLCVFPGFLYEDTGKHGLGAWYLPNRFQPPLPSRLLVSAYNMCSMSGPRVQYWHESNGNFKYHRLLVPSILVSFLLCCHIIHESIVSPSPVVTEDRSIVAGMAWLAWLQVCFAAGGDVQCRRFCGPLHASFEAIFSRVKEGAVSFVSSACSLHPVLLLRCQVCGRRVDDFPVHHARLDKWLPHSPWHDACATGILGKFDTSVTSHSRASVHLVLCKHYTGICSVIYILLQLELMHDGFSNVTKDNIIDELCKRWCTCITISKMCPLNHVHCRVRNKMLLETWWCLLSSSGSHWA